MVGQITEHDLAALDIRVLLDRADYLGKRQGRVFVSERESKPGEPAHERVVIAERRPRFCTMFSSTIPAPATGA